MRNNIKEIERRIIDDDTLLCFMSFLSQSVSLPTLQSFDQSRTRQRHQTQAALEQHHLQLISSTWSKILPGGNRHSLLSLTENNTQTASSSS
jgi:hypothetical protein